MQMIFVRGSTTMMALRHVQPVFLNLEAMKIYPTSNTIGARSAPSIRLERRGVGDRRSICSTALSYNLSRQVKKTKRPETHLLSI